MANIPQFIYGTAWKEEKTEALTLLALHAGFKAIDTANQRKHYFEEAVGRALSTFCKSGGSRDEIFLQTKYTYVRGQDHRLPYDPQSPISKQVKDSFEKSLEHLQTDFIDSYVLHGPWSGRGIHLNDREAWTAMESLVDQKRVKYLGLSNVTLEQLIQFYDNARIKPHFVQNRCFAVTGWDEDVREFCGKQSIRYQGFSLLTANIDWIQGPFVQGLAEKYSVTIPQIIFGFAMQVGMIPLTGTSDPEHMASDLETCKLRLEVSDLHQIQQLAFL